MHRTKFSDLSTSLGTDLGCVDHAHIRFGSYPLTTTMRDPAGTVLLRASMSESASSSAPDALTNRHLPLGAKAMRCGSKPRPKTMMLPSFMVETTVATTLPPPLGVAASIDSPIAEIEGHRLTGASTCCIMRARARMFAKQRFISATFATATSRMRYSVSSNLQVEGQSRMKRVENVLGEAMRMASNMRENSARLHK